MVHVGPEMISVKDDNQHHTVMVTRYFSRDTMNETTYSQGTMMTYLTTCYEDVFQRPFLHLCDVTTWQLQGWAGPSRLAEKLSSTNERGE